MDIYKIAAELESNNESFVIALIVNAVGSSPGRAGFKMIVKSDGSSIGTVGGGASCGSSWSVLPGGVRQSLRRMPRTTD